MISSEIRCFSEPEMPIVICTWPSSVNLWIRQPFFRFYQDDVLDALTADFKRSVQRLSEAIAKPKDEYLRDSVIQRFEFSVELAWKTCRRVMGSATVAPKDVIREMARNGYIDDADIWLKAIDKRNLSSHTYKEDLAEDVYAFAVSFIASLKALVKKLDSK